MTVSEFIAISVIDRLSVWYIDIDIDFKSYDLSCNTDLFECVKNHGDKKIVRLYAIETGHIEIII